MGVGTGCTSGAGNAAQPCGASAARLFEATPASEIVKTLPPTTTDRVMSPRGCPIGLSLEATCGQA